MSQWGRGFGFRRGTTEIKVTAHVKTDCFDLARRSSIVDTLILIDVCGDRAVAETMFSDLKARFVGRPYDEWPRVSGNTREI
jgi:hypothetical protein